MVAGVLDLRQWDLQRHGPVSLDGRWRFYWDKLIAPDDGSIPSNDLIKVPGSWAGHRTQGTVLVPRGTASYGLTIILPQGAPALMLYQRQVDTAMRLFVNGRAIGESGSPGLDASSTTSHVSVQTLLLPPPVDGRLEFVYHVSNYSNDIAGLWERIDLGTVADISARRERKLLIEFFLMGAFALTAMYHLGLFASRRQDLPALLFGLFCLIMALRIPVTGETTIHRFVSNLSYQNYKQLDHLLVYLGAPTFTGFLCLLFARRSGRYIVGYALASSMPFVGCVLFLDVQDFAGLLAYYEGLLIINILLLIGILVAAIIRKAEGAAVSLAGLLFLFATIVNDILASNLVINSPYYMSVGLFVFIFSQAYMLSRLFARAYNTAASLSAELGEKNQELVRLDQLKDEFLANTSHELRTPLGGIMGIADSLLAGVAGPVNQTMRGNLRLISYSGRRLASLVNDVLDFSKLRNQDIELRRRAVELSSVIDVVLALSSTLVGNKKVKLTNKVPELYVFADEERLEQIVHNLIGNAIKFTDVGEVLVHASRITSDSEEPGMLEVCIDDTGIGIEQSKRELIFKSFTQADGSISREYGGTGLGLAITRSLVELHGGRIEALARPGGGSRFLFTLPAASEEQIQAGAEVASAMAAEPEVSRARADVELPLVAFEPPTPGPPVVESGTWSAAAPAGVLLAAGAALPPARILIVDDDPVNLQVLHNHLSMSDYSVVGCGGGGEAISLLTGGDRFDLILLDVMMPRLSGYEVCRIVRETFSATELPVIMLTAKNRVSDLVIGFESGANDYLVKPFDARELLVRVRTLLELKNAALTQTHLATLQSEIQVAHRIQESLLPKILPNLAGLRIAARYRAMAGLAGDFYDFCHGNDTQLGVVVADVSGHGVPAALVVSMLKVALWFNQGEFSRPALLFEKINRSLLGNTGAEFVTACYVWLDMQKRKMGVVNAGHPPIYLLRKSGQLLSMRPFGRLLSVFPDNKYDVQEVDLLAGDRILLYTDGIIEASPADHQLFGQERLVDFIRAQSGATPEEFADRLLETIMSWSGGTELIEDDLSFVVIDVE